MKKIVSVFLIIIILIGSSSSAFTATAQSEEYKLSQMIKILDKINLETGSSLSIPDSEKTSVYNYYKEYSLSEFEAEIKRQYEESQYLLSSEPIIKSLKIEPFSVRETLKQKVKTTHSSYIVLESKVYGTGSPLIYKYRSVDKISIWYPESFTGFHLELSSYEFSFTSDYKTCNVKVYAYPKNKAGITQTVKLTRYATFNANP